MEEIYKLSIQQAMEHTQTTKVGLGEAEVNDRQQKHGYNELVNIKKDSFLKVFLSQFKDFLVLILLAAGIVSIFLGDYESAIVIFLVTVLNSILGTVQHFKAEKSLEGLKKLSSPVAKVIRDNIRLEIPSRDLVIGDILYLEAGDFISADGRIIENFSLQVNESSLTGESESITKHSDIIDGTDVAIGDRKNMVFSGSLVTYGRALAVVTAIGMNTEIGKIATLMESAQTKQTPLQVSLDAFGKKLAIAILVLCGIIFVVNVIRGYTVIDSFMFAVALAVAAIPEALSSIVTIVLAYGTQKMAKEHAIVRQLHAVESLGSVSVICSDKTGTLTQNKMVVKKLYCGSKISELGEIDLNNNLHRVLIKMSVLSSDAHISKNTAVGDPTEIALIQLAMDKGIDVDNLRYEHQRLSELPFDSERKLMSTLHYIEGNHVMFTKGAVDVILDRVTHIASDGGERKITEQDINSIEDINHQLSSKGLRVLAFCYKTFPQQVELTLKDEHDMAFLGLIAMIDPPRPESKQAVADCIVAGIKPVMITGDHKVTASAIAKEIGILTEGSRAIEGSDVENMTDEQLRAEVQNVAVYARVSPEHKIRIVRAWQDIGNVVAMTGDGVNDAPALKQADIGVAMGKVGTEVAKDAAAMILVDDNFATIVKAVSNGRSIYSNIKNSIKFLLSGNTAGILTVLYTSILALPLPFTAMHLLFINLLTDSLPAIALGLEPYRKDAMSSKPRDIKEPLLNKSFLFHVIFEGLVIAVCTLIAFYMGLRAGGASLASTMAFAVLTLSRLLHGFNCRSNKPIYKIGLFTNKFIWGALAVGILLLTLVIAIPVLQSLFTIDTLITSQLTSVIVLSLLSLVVIQISKAINTDNSIRRT